MIQKQKRLFLTMLLAVIPLFFGSFSPAYAFRFISWGDAQDSNTNLSATANQAAALTPAFTIFNGDLENDGVVNTRMDIMTAAFGSLLSKTFPVRGNHDDHIAGSDGLWETYFTNKWGAVRPLPPGVTNYTEMTSNTTYLTYSFDYENSRFIGIDAPGDSRDSAGNISSTEITFIDTRLADAESRGLTHAFIYFHGPVYCVESIHCSSTCNATTCLPTALIGVINKHPIVSATFHGHEHILGWTHLNKTRITALTHEFEQFITSPSGGYTYNSYLYPARMDYYYPTVPKQGFAAVDVNGPSFTFSIYVSGNSNPVWSKTFTKSGTVMPTSSAGFVTPTPTRTPAPTPTKTPTPIRTPTMTPPVTPPVSGAYYVSPAGSGTACSNTSPCSLNTGLGKLVAGNTLYLHGGTYQQIVSITKSGTSDTNRVTVRGYPGELAVIDGNDSGCGQGCWYTPQVQISGSYVTFRDIEVKRGFGMGIRITGNNSVVSNVSSHDNWENGILISGNNDTVENSRVYNNCLSNQNGIATRDGYWASGLSAARGPTGSVIRGNTVYNTWGEGISTYGTNHATVEDNISYNNWSVNVYVQNAQYITVQRNLVYHTPDNIFSGLSRPGIQTGIVEDNEGPDATYGTSANNIFINNVVYGAKGNFVHWSGSIGMQNTIIANNTFVNTRGSFANVDIRGTNTGVHFVNNIIVQDDTQSISNIGSGVTKSNNLWSRTPSSNAAGTNDIIGNPVLSRTGVIAPGELTGAWFTLGANSPAIDKAVSLSQVINDYFKTPRPYGPLPDIGAYEAGSGQPVAGDLNGDGHVDLYDYNILVTNFGTLYTIYDYNALVENFGT